MPNPICLLFIAETVWRNRAETKAEDASWTADLDKLLVDFVNRVGVNSNTPYELDLHVCGCRITEPCLRSPFFVAFSALAVL